MSEPSLSEIANAKLASATRLTANTRTSSRLRQLPQPMSQLKDQLAAKDSVSAYTRFFGQKPLNDHFCAVFDENGILGFETAAGTVELYLNAAAAALTQVDIYDTSAAQTLQQVIAYFAAQLRAMYSQKLVFEQSIDGLVRGNEALQLQLHEANTANLQLQSALKELKTGKINAEIEFDRMNIDYVAMQKEMERNGTYQTSLTAQIQQYQAELEATRSTNSHATKQNNYYHTELNDLRTRYEQLLITHEYVYKTNQQNEQDLGDARLQISLLSESQIGDRLRIDALLREHNEELNCLHKENTSLIMQSQLAETDALQKERQQLILYNLKQRELADVNASKQQQLIKHIETQRSLANLGQRPSANVRNSSVSRYSSDQEEYEIEEECEIDAEGNVLIRQKKRKRNGKCTQFSRPKKQNLMQSRTCSQANLGAEFDGSEGAFSSVATQTNLTLKDVNLLLKIRQNFEKLVPDAKQRAKVLGVQIRGEMGQSGSLQSLMSKKERQKKQEVDYEQKRANLKQAIGNAQIQRGNYQQQLTALQKWMEANPDKISEEAIRQMEDLKMSLINTNHDIEVLQGEYKYVKKQEIEARLENGDSGSEESDKTHEDGYRISKNSTFQDQYGYKTQAVKQGTVQKSYITREINAYQKVNIDGQFNMEIDGMQESNYIDDRNIQMKNFILNQKELPLIKGVYKNLAKIEEDRVRYLKELQTNLRQSQKQQKLQAYQLKQQAQNILKNHLLNSKRGKSNITGLVVKTEEDIRNGKKLYQQNQNHDFENPFKQILRNRKKQQIQQELQTKITMDNLRKFRNKDIETQDNFEKKLFSLIAKIKNRKNTESSIEKQDPEETSSSDYYDSEHSSEIDASANTNQDDKIDESTPYNLLLGGSLPADVILAPETILQSSTTSPIHQNFGIAQSHSPNKHRFVASSLLALQNASPQFEKAIFSTSKTSVFMYKNLFSFFEDFDSLNTNLTLDSEFSDIIIDEISALFYKIIKPSASSKHLLQENTKIVKIEFHEDFDSIFNDFKLQKIVTNGKTYALMPYNIQLKSLTWILNLTKQIIEFIFDDFASKAFKFMTNPNQQYNTQGLILNFVQTTYGLEILSQNIVLHLISNLISHRKNSSKIELLYLLLTNKISILQLQFLSFLQNLNITSLTKQDFQSLILVVFSGISIQNNDILLLNFDKNQKDNVLQNDQVSLLFLRFFSLQNVRKNIKMVSFFPEFQRFTESQKKGFQALIAPFLPYQKINVVEEFLSIFAFSAKLDKLGNAELVGLSEVILKQISEALSAQKMEKTAKRAFIRLIRSVRAITEAREGVRAWACCNQLIWRWQEGVIK
ncbi:hypothetical protein SS50377_20790 [Spironucleus salmonicida]|uniref:Uncharacterized protein n=1 Tax=Spironucleus salmonicida TaxID=348837 RepID=V6LQZ5_9EUKA|nr:hypothetical protein SS50377_20790 [Spironucleus salmonicida]|eukprot:EST47102.1 hypothetical protein SS50377_12808 [Spironucleus salmonicida]